MKCCWRDMAVRRRAGLVASALLLTVSQADPAAGQANTQNRTVTVNYVYAAEIGIGNYEVGGLTVKVLELPLSYTFVVDEERGWKLKVKAPVDLGIYSFSATDVDGTKISVDQQSLGLVPGLELQVPVTDNWVMKPFVDSGVAYNFQTNESIYVYSTGARSVVSFGWQSYTLSLGNALVYAGNTDFSSSGNEAYLAVETGGEVRRSLGFKIRDFEPDIGVYTIYYYYPHSLTFSRFLEEPLRVKNQVEIGFSIGSAEPFEIWSYKNPRIGAGYIFGDGLTVFRVNFGFPF